MQKPVVLTVVALLALPVPAYAQGPDKQKEDRAESHSQVGKSGRKGEPSDKSSERADSQHAQPSVKQQAKQSAAETGRDLSKSDGNLSSLNAPAQGQGKGKGPSQQPIVDRGDKSDRTTVTHARADRTWGYRIRAIENGRYTWRDPGFRGCPPGLAKKGTGCLPPGQARKLSSLDDGVFHWYRYSDWYRADPRYDWRYDRGYAYRVDPGTGLVLSVLPLLGGALFGGHSWPQTYVDYDVPPYYDRFYGHDDAYDYRYADGAVFAVDPETQVIQSIAGLLTGDSWAIGAPMPQGYDLYNVPYGYRDRYVDSPSSLYRYDDGYIYEVDPTTQLVRAFIELVV